MLNLTQVIVGTPSRAYTLAGHFDDAPKRFELGSERGFLTLTGRYKGVPMSVISIGMGHPNVDFFVREVRECLSGDMCVVRLVDPLAPTSGQLFFASPPCYNQLIIN